jgi:hypothetical protein
MLDVPRQNWSLVERLSRRSDAAWWKSLAPGDRFDLYADLFNLIWESRGSQDNHRLEQRRWRQKLETRLRVAGAFARLDEWRRARAAAKHAP